jgi:TctA family transporter
MIEEQFRRSLVLGGDSFAIFANRPIALAVMGFTVLIVASPLILRGIKRVRQGSERVTEKV